MVGQTVVFYEPLQLFDHVGIIHVDPGYIDGYGQRDAQTLLPVSDLCSRLRPDIVVQRLDQSVVLKQRNEHAGTHHAQFGVLPANQRLCAAQDRFLGAHIDLGLIVDHELFLADRGREILDQLFR